MFGIFKVVLGGLIVMALLLGLQHFYSLGGMSKGMPNDIIATTTPTIFNVPLAETSPAVIDGGELHFVSTLSPQNKPTTTADCVIGGCSSQLCLDVLENDMVTTCEWREHYACYRTAVCEPQINGHCGWTKDKEFTQCLVEKEVM